MLGARRTCAAGAVIAAALLLPACTAGRPAWQSAGPGPDVPGAPPAAAPSSTRSAVLHAPSAPAVVVDQADPVAAVGAVADLLFDSSPVVVVAASGDPEGVADAAEQAARLRAPVLLTGPAASAVAHDGSVPPPPDGLTDELRRLDARTVLAVGTVRPDALPPGVDVVTDARGVPAQAAPGLLDDVALLVLRAPDPGGAALAAAAAAGTARAAGAVVVPVSGTDPRADGEAVTAISNAAPEHVIGLGAGFGPADRLADRAATAATGVQLPGGGQVFFPGRRLVALYGHPGTAGLGALGQQDLPATLARARAVAAQYDPLSDVPVVPTFEIIATVAQGAPGADGDYSGESSVDELRPWVEEAGRQGFYVVLDLQPGRADLLAQAELYRPLLELPYVGLALDPEWALGPGQLPLQQIGGVDATQVNRVSTWLDQLTAAAHLPQKLLVLHQFRLSMIRHEQRLQTALDHVSLLVHMDGQGPVPVKMGTWAAVTAAAPPGTPFGWKNFYEKDPRTMTPAETMAVRPTPLMISYQ